MNKIHLNISGMANSESKTKIKNSLTKIEGIQQIAVDLARGSVEIEYNSPATENEIKTCIENTGYSIK
ncbi:heavy-metal-associated domain-containing protein [Clostridium senegalense]|uniref:Heavy-metal-associated domain-containing protein n=1 Tax=Clostridium senegalense TaxID=1465809 RepID=A0A6M0H0C7_9CLOT|nr:heavy metal-associated domain-containing protein [Clostridium senegalense]NEU03638.1 heavy-metal-associated domain-containing protein [Clostridium senegalense]